MAEESPSLATVLTRWIRRERLRPYDIERASGITRAHLWLMTHGRVKRPTPETLRKLAKALASDPETGEVDRLKRNEALREMSAAVGYADPGSSADRDDLVRVVGAVVGNQQVTEFWCELISEHPDVSPTLQYLIRAVITVHDRPGGSDVTSLLLALDGYTSPELAELARRLSSR
jgi:transcriptional regulator with XRE-family HTH domain